MSRSVAASAAAWRSRPIFATENSPRSARGDRNDDEKAMAENYLRAGAE